MKKFIAFISAAVLVFSSCQNPFPGPAFIKLTVQAPEPSAPGTERSLVLPLDSVSLTVTEAANISNVVTQNLIFDGTSGYWTGSLSGLTPGDFIFQALGKDTLGNILYSHPAKTFTVLGGQNQTLSLVLTARTGYVEIPMTWAAPGPYAATLTALRTGFAPVIYETSVDPLFSSSTKYLVHLLEGDWEVTASVKDAGMTYTATSIVSVLEGKKTTLPLTLGLVPVPLSSLSLDKSLVSLSTADSPLQLTPLYTPSNSTEKGILWTSSNGAVASVDGNGLVTPIAVGNCTITAKSVINPTISALCDITVTQGPQEYRIYWYYTGTDTPEVFAWIWPSNPIQEIFTGGWDYTEDMVRVTGTDWWYADALAKGISPGNLVNFIVKTTAGAKLTGQTDQTTTTTVWGWRNGLTGDITYSPTWPTGTPPGQDGAYGGEVIGAGVLPSDKKITVSWTAYPGDTDVAQVLVNWTQEGYTDATSATAFAPATEIVLTKGLVNGFTYLVTVRTVDFSGNYSPGLNFTGVTPVDNVGPAPVTSLTAVPTALGGSLGWIDPVDTDLSFIRIFWTDGSALFTDVSKGLQTFDTNLTAGGTYTFTLVPYDLAGNPGSGAEILLDLHVPAGTGTGGITDGTQDPWQPVISGGSASLIYGTNMTLSAAIGGNFSNLDWKWFLNGILLPGETSNTLVIGADLPLGTYHLQTTVTGLDGSGSSEVLSFTVTP